VSADAILLATKAIVERVAGPARTPADSGPDTRLGDGYWLDSVELLEIVVACEQEFGILFDEARDFEGGSLDTLGSLAALVRTKRAARSAL
jgi:acyl carrier protein